MRYLLIFVLISFSCSTKKDILLLQDIQDSKIYDLKFEEILIKSDDILKIQIKTKLPELDQIFNQNNQQNNTGLEVYQINGYQVSPGGLISLPIIGSLNVSGLTVFDVSKLIKKELINQDQLINPVVDVKIVNAYFTILGEVKNPGRYSFLKNNINIFQAIGMAGDLTINGERSSIKVLRTTKNKLKSTNIDLTSSNLISSQNFQIFPGDIIIINPNSSRVKNAGIIGNAGNLLSVLSFILSSIILITSN